MEFIVRQCAVSDEEVCESNTHIYICIFTVILWPAFGTKKALHIPLSTTPGWGVLCTFLGAGVTATLNCLPDHVQLIYSRIDNKNPYPIPH